MSHSFIYFLIIASALFLSISASTARAAENQQNSTPLVMVANFKVANPTIPIIFMADPGLAFVISAPLRQLQVSVEGDAGVCLEQLLQTDENGVAEIPIAATRRCVRPRLVVTH